MQGKAEWSRIRQGEPSVWDADLTTPVKGERKGKIESEIPRPQHSCEKVSSRPLGMEIPKKEKKKKALFNEAAEHPPSRCRDADLCEDLDGQDHHT